jgi:hypothetical protein
VWNQALFDFEGLCYNNLKRKAQSAEHSVQTKQRISNVWVLASPAGGL